MGLSLTVLGCSGTWASADSACSGYLVHDASTRVWIDCGPGTLQALQRHCALHELDAIVVTHNHPDHCMELPVVRNAMKYGLDLRNVPLVAPRGVFALLETLLGTRGITPSFAPRMIGDRSVIEIGTLRFTFSRTDHPVETVAVRVDAADDASLAYSSDTGPGWSLQALGVVDLAIVEGTLLASQVGPAEAVHLTAEQAGIDARRSGARRLVLTHVPPTGDGEAHRAEAEAAFGATVTLAHPHHTYEVTATHE